MNIFIIFIDIFYKLIKQYLKGNIMDIIKRLFNFNNDEKSAIGLCKFNDDFFRAAENKEKAKKRFSKELTLSEMLKKCY